MFVTSSTTILEKLTQFCTLENPLNFSSHDPILTEIKIKTEAKIQASKHAASYSEFKREKIIWDERKMPEYQALAAKALSEAGSYWDTPETIPLLVSLNFSLLVNCAKQKQYTLSKAVRAAEKKVIKYFKSWKDDGKPQSKQSRSRLEYTSARSDF